MASERAMQQFLKRFVRDTIFFSLSTHENRNSFEFRFGANPLEPSFEGQRTRFSRLVRARGLVWPADRLLVPKAKTGFARLCRLRTRSVFSRIEKPFWLST